MNRRDFGEYLLMQMLVLAFLAFLVLACSTDRAEEPKPVDPTMEHILIAPVPRGPIPGNVYRILDPHTGAVCYVVAKPVSISCIPVVAKPVSISCIPMEIDRD